MRAAEVRLSEIVKLPRNAKLHDVGDIAASLGEFGFVDRVIINETTGHLVGGAWAAGGAGADAARGETFGRWISREKTRNIRP